MNSRERVRLILNHQEADRPAIDLGSTYVTGTSAWSYRALKKALGIDSDTVRAYDLYQMLAEIEEPVLDALGCDFCMLVREPLQLGLTYGKWKPFVFWDGQAIVVPADFSPRVTEDGGLEAPRERGGPVIMRMPNGGWFFDRIPSTVEDIFSTEHIPESEWEFIEPLTDEFLRYEEERARALYESTDRAVVAAPSLGTPQGYGGSYYWAMKMLREPQYCLDYMMRAGEASAECYEQYVQAVGDYIDVICISASDYGTQDREMFRPTLFRDFYTPSWKLVTDAIHHHPIVKVFIHTCGAVPKLLPYFVEAGVDILNPVQWTAGGMDLRWMKETYGDKLSFWGGAISTQRTFPFGSPDDVVREATDVLDIMSPGGGYVVNPIHNVLPEVPVENIIALYRTAQNYRYK